MERLGAIVRLQVQASPVKERDVGYRPERILAVPEVALSADGVLGHREGAWVIDVHHRRHPERRGSPQRVVSFGFTAHYEEMRGRYGDRVAAGVAGENVIVATDGRVGEDDLAGGLVIRTAAGDELAVEEPRPAAPCAEFTSYLLGRGEVGASAELADDLAFLDSGTRGFVAGLGGLDGTLVVRLGDEVWRS